MKWLYFIILTLIWGSSFILIKLGVTSFTPMQVGSLRVGIAGLFLLPYAVLSIKNIPKHQWKWLILAGALGNFLPMFLFPAAETKISSSLAGILNSLTPIWVLILGYLVYHIKKTWIQVLGAIIGFLGAFILIFFSSSNHSETTNYWYGSLIVIATMMYGMSALLIKKHLTKIPSLQLSSVVFGIFLLPSLIILCLTGFFQDFQGTSLEWKGLFYISILGIFGTALAMILFYKLIQISSAVFASSVTYVMPIVAVGWGLLYGEKLNYFFLIGGALILLGVYLIQEKLPSGDKN